jgi:hypothetical protein
MVDFMFTVMVDIMIMGNLGTGLCSFKIIYTKKKIQKKIPPKNSPKKILLKNFKIKPKKISKKNSEQAASHSN